MHVFVLFALVAAGLALDQAWKRHRIRADFAALQRTILGIRWLPLGRFARARRDESSFRVVYATVDGVRRTCACVASTWGSVSILDERVERDESGPDRERPRAARPARDAGGALAFHGACFASALVTCVWIGASYWTAPYRSLQLPTALYGSGLVVAGAFAAALAWWRPRRWLAIAAWTIGAVVAVIAVRVALDLRSDPSTHNLLGLEIVIAAFVGAVTAGIGVGLARVARLALPSRAESAS